MGTVTLADEAVQEVFLRLWDRPERFDSARGSLRSFPLAQGHGRSLDLLRAESAAPAGGARGRPAPDGGRRPRASCHRPHGG
ncbi:sigma factor [Rhabdothermincola sediminis]|uniref:sigma factor n=1 Tax=Rhabdothermincola sediminis TaxID=2751370 RepID=UPI003558E0CB